MRFEVHSSGDPDVGLAGVDAVVAFEDNAGWDEHWVGMVKDFLREFYDVGLHEVFTEAEYAELLDKQGEYGG